MLNLIELAEAGYDVPLYINLPLVSDAAIERAIIQEQGA